MQEQKNVQLSASSTPVVASHQPHRQQLQQQQQTSLAAATVASCQSSSPSTVISVSTTRDDPTFTVSHSLPSTTSSSSSRVNPSRRIGSGGVTSSGTVISSPTSSSIGMPSLASVEIPHLTVRPSLPPPLQQPLSASASSRPALPQRTTTITTVVGIVATASPPTATALRVTSAVTGAPPSSTLQNASTTISSSVPLTSVMSPLNQSALHGNVPRFPLLPLAHPTHQPPLLSTQPPMLRRPPPLQNAPATGPSISTPAMVTSQDGRTFRPPPSISALDASRLGFVSEPREASMPQGASSHLPTAVCMQRAPPNMCSRPPPPPNFQRPPTLHHSIPPPPPPPARFQQSDHYMGYYNSDDDYSQSSVGMQRPGSHRKPYNTLRITKWVNPIPYDPDDGKYI